MSNRAALRRLSRRIPAPPEIEEIMETLSEGTDLSIAITATAVLETGLERLLITKFAIKNKKLTSQIFINAGPLSDFHSKILIATAFGVVTSVMAEEMNSIRAIRNTFAHAKVPLTFDHELVEKEVDSFAMINAMNSIRDESGRGLPLENKIKFLLVTKILLIMISIMEEHGGSASDALASALSED